MKKSKTSTVFSIIEALVAIVALAFFILLIIPGVGMGYIISSLSGQYGQTIYIVSIIATLVIAGGMIALIIISRDVIVRKRKRSDKTTVNQ